MNRDKGVLSRTMRENDVKIFAIVKSPLPCEAMPAAVAKVRSGPKIGVQIAGEMLADAF